MIVGARPATAADLPALVDLLAAARLELTPTKGGDVWSRREGQTLNSDGRRASALDDPDRLLLVGTIDDIVVGYSATHVEQLEDGSRLARLTDIYVEVEARGVGVGEALIDDILAWGRAQGCFGVDSLALPGNRATKNFFEAHGLVARAIVVHRRLGPL